MVAGNDNVLVLGGCGAALSRKHTYDIVRVHDSVFAEAQQPRRGGNLPREIGAWLHIDQKGAVTVYTGKVEIGQNIRTSLTQVVAEELRLPISPVGTRGIPCTLDEHGLEPGRPLGHPGQRDASRRAWVRGRGRAGGRAQSAGSGH